MVKLFRSYWIKKDCSELQYSVAWVSDYRTTKNGNANGKIILDKLHGAA